MSATTTNAANSGNRGRRNQRGRRNGRKNEGGRVPLTDAAAATNSSEPKNIVVKKQEAPDMERSSDVESVCFICAEPVKYWSLSACNHRTCHICALRLRALYKKTECTFCKFPQETVIFTVSPTSLFSNYDVAGAPFKDSKLEIVFETQEMMEETLALLRFNCPDDSCVFVAKGWNDLKVHARAIHGRSMCDLCIRFKKVFSHEHSLYTSNQLQTHLPSLRLRHGRGHGKEKNKIDVEVHPYCEFCRECLFSDDEMFAHMRERHEECFLCKRQGIRDQYFENYNSLERHFYDAHYPCRKPECQAEKFVVFGSEMDFKAHMLEKHGSQMTAKEIRDAQRVEVHFAPTAVDRGGRGRGQQREPDRTEQQRSTTGVGGRRREGFGSSLTSENNANLQNGRLSPSVGDVDPETAKRHIEFMKRVASLTSGSTAAETAVRSVIWAYRSSESGARDVISTFYNIVDRDVEATASLIIPLVDLLDDEDKKQELLGAFNGFKIEQRQEFPDLLASGAGRQVLNAKHSTQSRQSTGQIWDRVARAATSSSGAGPAVASRHPAERFPALPQAAQPVKLAKAPSKPPAFRQTPRSTPWASSSSSSPAPTPPPVPVNSTPSQVPSSSTRPFTTSRPTVNQPKKTSDPAPPKFSKSAFPSLPAATSRPAKPQLSGNQSLKNILGNTGPSTVAWRGDDDDDADDADDGTTNQGRQGKGKRKGKEKMTLFTLNSFAL